MHHGRGKVLQETNNDASFLTGRTRLRRLGSALAAIGTAAFAVEIPFFFLGTPSGHDLEFHLNSWLEVLSQWRQGILFPRWAALANFGYGEPRFIFYPPASWMLGAFLSALFPWGLVGDVYIWIALTLAGMSMFLLARRWFSERNAIFAGALYALNPYHLVIVYWRSAFAELLASCLVPILFLLMLRIAEGERRLTIPLALVLAAAWLTNAPAAVMIHYSLALLLLVFAVQKRSTRILGTGAAAIIVGACLAGFYLLPAIYEQRWVDIARALQSGGSPEENFLFAHTGDLPHDNFNHIVSWIAVFEMAILLVTSAAARLRGKLQHEIWNALFIWGSACGLLMFPVTLLAWRVLPKLEFMQFPWRWMLCLSMVFSIFFTVATSVKSVSAAGTRVADRGGWRMRAAICVAGLVIIAAAWHFIQPPWWDNAADLRELRDNFAGRVGYEGVDEYIPVEADPSAIDKNAANVSVPGTNHAVITIAEWGPERKTFTAETSTPTQLALRLFRYPGWKAEVNGHEVPTVTGDAGQLIVPVGTGVSHFEIKFARTWDRAAGGWISGITGLCVAASFFFSRKRT